MTDLENAAIDCPRCHGSGMVGPRGFSTADPKPCPICTHTARKIAEERRWWVDLVKQAVRNLRTGDPGSAAREVAAVLEVIVQGPIP